MLNFLSTSQPHILALERISFACFALLIASSFCGLTFGFMRIKFLKPKFFIALHTAPRLPAFSLSTQIIDTIIDTVFYTKTTAKTRVYINCYAKFFVTPFHTQYRPIKKFKLLTNILSNFLK